jgi:PAS domain S-box-containing protein
MTGLAVHCAAGPLHSRLLLVDDDPLQLELSTIHFREVGFEVTAAAGAREALDAARHARPDIVVSDVLMPVMDGFELCMVLRRDPLLCDVPVVLISGRYATDVDQHLATRAGANALVCRTSDFREAITAVRRAVSSGPSGVAPSGAAPSGAESPAAAGEQPTRQRAAASRLAQRCAFQVAQLSLLGGVADALTRNSDPALTTGAELAATLETAGISKGAVIMRDPGKGLLLRHSIGFSEAQRASLDTFFGHASLLEAAIEQRRALSIPSPSLRERVVQAVLTGADAVCVHVVPLISDGRGIGAIVLAAHQTDVTSEDAVAFARAMGNQMVQSLKLADAFARLAESETRYRILLENAGDAIAVLTPGGIISEVNRRWEEIVGTPAPLLVGRNIREFAPQYRGGLPESERGGAGALRIRPVEVQKQDGSIALMEFSNTVLELKGEGLVFAIGRDVTAQVRAQEQLLVSERMASIGSLAAAVAHEINNPLAAVTGNLELAARALIGMLSESPASTNLSEISEAVGDAHEAADRVRDIVRDLRVFSRTEDDELGPVDVRRSLESSLRIAGNEIRHRAELIVDYGDVPFVHANTSRLGQVFLNLLVNAAQAIPEGHADKNQIHVRTRYDEAARTVVVEIADTGSGIAPELMRKLFRPFFTTKSATSGTGLGLAICQRIVTSFGGNIGVDSALGEGTVFRVVLAATEGSARLPAFTPAIPCAARRGRILVVDDEPLIGRLATRCLCREHDVSTAATAAAALACIVAGERFDVILCDLMMPTMTGFDLQDALLGVAPEQAECMVFLSGGAFTAEARSRLSRQPHAHLEKPFKIDALIALVNERMA